MLIKNGLVFLNKSFVRADIAFSDVITDIFEAGGQNDKRLSPSGEVKDIIDAEGCYVVPGFIDIHTHGAAGADFSDGGSSSMRKLSEFYISNAVTSFLATTATLTKEEYISAMRSVRDFKPEGGAKCLGVHLEGPFISNEKRGAQNPDNIREPDFDFFKLLNDESGNKVKLITVAPELSGAVGFIKEASKVCAVSLGHTAADYDTAMKAFRAGASHLTHLFNAMPPLLHRAPGPVGSAFDSGAYAELICDGIHVHPAAVRAAYRLFGDKLILISDSLRCAGMPEGSYMLGGRAFNLKNGKATLPDGTLAGSTITLHTGVKKFVEFGMTLEAAIYAASTAPADAVGATDTGRLAAGKAADILILDKNLNILKVFTDGKQVKSVMDKETRRIRGGINFTKEDF